MRRYARYIAMALLALCMMPATAQDISVSVQPVQQVLPPQAGQYIDNPGKFFTVRLTNNSDVEQMVHIGMHIDQTFPEEQVMVVTPYGHIPRQPITVAPRQTKTLNPIEMKQLFTHFQLDEIFIRDGLYNDYRRGIFGLLPEGQYRLYLQAYKWDPEITSAVQLNMPDNGLCDFSVCYMAQAPTFITPQSTLDATDPLSLLSVARIDVTNPGPHFTWTLPTLKCNPSLYPFEYDVKIVRLDDLMPDEAIERNAVEYQRQRLTTPTLSIPASYLTKMMEQTRQNPSTVYAIQVTARSSYQNTNNLNFATSAGNLNFSLIENDGRSPVLLFRLYDPKDEAGKAESDDVTDVSVEDGEAETEESDLYVFEQPTLTSPQFSSAAARKVFVGDSIRAEWRKAWFAGGKGERQDTVKFEYTVNLYKGNSADTPEGIFTSKPVYTNKTTELADTIRWDKLKGKVNEGDYLMLRVTAQPTNVKESIRMHGDSLNYKDFAMCEHVEVDYDCGVNTANITNKTPIAQCPKEGTKVRIGDWTLELSKGVEQDAQTKALKGTGFIEWTPGLMKLRVAVKFDKLMVNTDLVCYDGTCQTYPDPKGGAFLADDEKISSQDAVDALFSDWGLDTFFSSIDSELADKVSSETTSLAEEYEFGKYYSYFKKGKNQWDKAMAGEPMDIYFPTQLPDTIAQMLPDDLSMQIASIQYSPRAAVMNIIGELVLPKTDVLKDKVLVFGAPRLCIQKDRFFPEDGTLALLHNFTIKDPDSDFDMTFKAPMEPLRPQDGCYLEWRDDSFDGLGIEVAMHIPGLDRVVDGKVQEGVEPICDLKATIENSWADWMGTITMSDFQVRDLPGWTFRPGQTITYDHSYNKNDSQMPSLDKVGSTYDPSKVGSHVKRDWLCWQGLFIKDIGVGFPKWYVFGKDDEGLQIDVTNMLFDASGVTCRISASNIFEAKTGSAGGWRFNIDDVNVDIVQNNFDNCTIHGGFGVPLFGKKAAKKENEKAGIKDKDDDVETDVKYTCEIRHLTDPTKTEEYYTYVQKRDANGTPLKDQYEKVKHTRHEYGKDARYAYIFKCEQVDDLQMNCFVADLTLLQNQTYFLLEAEDQPGGETKTEVELCMAGDITIAGANTINESIKAVTANLPLDLTLPGIHFAKMRLSNVKRENWTLGYEKDEKTGLQGKRDKAEADWQASHGKRIVLVNDGVIALGDKCFFNYGEWSLASEKKKIGPFSFSLKEFDFDYKNNQLSLDLGGTIGLIGDKIEASAGIAITSKLDMSGSSVSDWSLSNGKVSFREAALALDFSALRLEGTLKVSDDSEKKGYAGNLDIEITGLFGLKCEGGYYRSDKSWAVSADEQAEMEADAKETNETLSSQEKSSYSWGYFKVDMESNVGLRFDPLVINRISGGFYFNCRPTKGPDKEKDKFGGEPVGQYGMIGVAMGLGLNTSAGKETLSADMDLLVVYDRKNKCLSTFMFDGKVNAVGGMVKADASLVYENIPQTRYLTLNVTVEAGWDTGDLTSRIAELNAGLKSVKDKLDDFQKEVDGVYKHITEAPMKGLKQISGDYNANDDGVAAEDDDVDTGNAGSDATDMKVTAGKATISLELSIRWRRNGQNYSTPKWHLYLGEPSRDKRCSFTFLKFGTEGKSICWADIGADGYLCLGNELPDNGALPPIPAKIQEFLSGHKNANTDMNADLKKAERSRSKAVKNLLKEGNVDGGVMVGASAWGDIGLDLGLLYGSLESMAGFDASLVHYGSNAVCVNTRSAMGKNGWYAMGQIYAFLEAELGLHIKIGSLIDTKIKLLYAGIGGVLELGLPNPSWVEGQARVKISLLAGLVKLNKKFGFSAGDHCVPFLGNAIDGFELFSDVSLGSDSLYEALYRPEFAISQYDANRMVFTTNASLGSHFRLVDPSYQAELAKEVDVEEDSLLNHLSSRTYVFDMDQNLNMANTKMGVRLLDLGTTATQIVKNKPGLTPEQFYEEMGAISESQAEQNARSRGYYYQTLNSMVASVFADKGKTVSESNVVMKSSDINSQEERLLHGSTTWASHMNEILNKNTVTIDKNTYKASYIMPVENSVSFREDRGTTFHLTGMGLQPGHSYALFLEGNAYEIMNGKRVWVDYFDSEGDQEYHYIKWRQDKVWFFRVKSNDEDKVIGDSLRNLEPYVALAYPSVDGTKVKSGSEGLTTAYYNDIMHPTIALNRDLRGSLSENKMKWVLTPYHADDLEKPVAAAQTRDVRLLQNGNCFNLEPASAFSSVSVFARDYSKAQSGGRTYDFENEVYHLELQYTYKYQVPSKRGVELRDSTFSLVDLWLTSAPHSVPVSKWGSGTKLTDNWYLSTDENVTGKVLAYSEPFVGARPTKSPTFGYQNYYNSQKNSNLSTDAIWIWEDGQKLNGKVYRLIDPYLYFAYLGCWTFIGDRKIDSYAFDDAYIPFASESLIYEYNGTVVNCEMLKNPEGEQGLMVTRDKMYTTWDDWNYGVGSGAPANSNIMQPYYPLPQTLKSVGGPTVNNQDGKAATVTPLSAHRYTDYRYCLQDMAMDFIAPYSVAQQLGLKLKEEAFELWRLFAYRWFLQQEYSMSFNDPFDNSVKDYNNLHRGQYINVTDRGVNVRIPYYQLPLIFGDCFGGDGATYQGKSLDKHSRTFKTSVGQDDTPKGRWPSWVSNVAFWRLMGTDPSQHAFKPYGLDPEVFSRHASHSMYNYAYMSPSNTSREVQWDEFNASTALKNVSGMQALMYRVNAYDVSKGEYTVVEGLGGLPGSKVVNLTGVAGAGSMGEVYDELVGVAATMESTYDTKRPQALWSSSQKTLYLTYSSERYEKSVDAPIIYKNGAPIDTVWYDNDVKDAVWKNTISLDVERVVIDASFKDADLRSLKDWFKGCSHLVRIEGLENLNTEKVTDMSRMFYNCKKLDYVKLYKLNTAMVTDMSYMFFNCKALTTIDLRSFDTEKVTLTASMFAGCDAVEKIFLSSFNTKNVTSMYQMFAGCKALQSIYFDPDKFTTAKVEDMSYMFMNCSSLKILNLKTLQSDKLSSTHRMFAGCTSLTHLYLNDFVAYDVGNTEGMFNNCTSLKYINLKEFIPQVKYRESLSNMFTNVPEALTAYINYDLDDRIKEQIPGNKSMNYSENVQAVYFTTNSGTSTEKHYLAFLNASVKYSDKKNNFLKIGDTGLTGKVVDAWSGVDVLNAAEVKWKSVKSLISEIIFAPSFKQSPKYMNFWFDGCRSLTKIEGLKNLNTKKTEMMDYMFRNCSKLTDLSEASYFQTDNVTTMSGMFEGCTALTSVGTYNWNTKNVKDMRAMFKGCSSLTRLSFDYYFETDNVTDMKEMFMKCSKLTRIDCKSTFNTANVTSMASMFEGCSALEDVYDLTHNMNGSSLTTIAGMFKDCSSLKEIEMPLFSTPKTTEFLNAFYNCRAMKLLDLSSLSSESLKTCNTMFYLLPYQCTIYLPYDISEKITSQLSAYRNLILLYPAKVLKVKYGSGYELDFINSKQAYKVGDTYNGREIVSIWSGNEVYNTDSPGWSGYSASNVNRVVIDESFKQIVPRSLKRWFDGMSKITGIYGLEYLNTSKAKSMNSMFSGCSKLKNLSVKTFDISELTDMGFMFYGCSSLTDLDLSTFDTRRITDMGFMFSGCSSLKTLNLSNFYTWNVTMMSSMFGGCSSLTELDLTKMDTKAVTQAYGMFSGVTSLTKLRLGQNFTFDKLTSTGWDAFKNVGSLSVIVPEAQLEAIRQKFTQNLGFVEGETGWFYTSEPESVAQAILTEDNATLTFCYGPKVTTRFRGADVTQVWSGTDVTASADSYPKWTNVVKADLTTVVFDPSFVAVRPLRLAGWFLNCSKLSTVTDLKYLNSSEAITMSNMFQGCSSLKSLDLSTLRADKVTTIGFMFCGCSSLTELNLKGLGSMPAMKNNISGLFSGCRSLKTIDMGDIRTTNVTMANRLFENCTRLRDLKLNYLGLFDKVSPKATNAFTGVTNLEVKAPTSYGAKTRSNFTQNLGFVEGTHGFVVDESEIVTEAIWTEGNTTLTFARKRLYAPGEKFNGQTVTAVWSGDDVMRTSVNYGVAPKWVATVKNKVTRVVFDDTFDDQPGTNNQYYPQSFGSWFDGCSKLVSVTGLQHARSERATLMTYMFRGCSALTQLDMSEFKSTMTTNMSGMFEGCKSLKTLKLGGLYTARVISMTGMFKDCSSLTSLDLSNFSTAAVISMADMFSGCNKLTSLKLSNFSTSKVTNMSGMFRSCSALTSLDLSSFNTSKVTNMSYMFYQCKALTSIPTGNFDTSNVTDMSCMFYSCNALWKPDVKNFDTSRVTDMSLMFANCSAATSIDVSKFDTQQVTSMKMMFQACSSLTSLTLTSFNTQKVESMLQMFYNCKNLKSLDLSSFNTSKVTVIRLIFGNCTAMTQLKVSNMFRTDNATDRSSGFSQVKGLTVQVPKSSMANVTTWLKNIGFVEGTTGTITTY